MELHLLRSFSGYWEVVADWLKRHGRFLLLSVVFDLILLAMIIVSAVLAVNVLANKISWLILPIILIFLLASHFLVKQFIRLNDGDEEDLADKMPRPTERAAHGCRPTLGGVPSDADR